MQECKRLSGALVLVMAAMTAACASSGKVRPQPFPSPISPAQPAVPASPALPAPPESPSLIDTALSYRGTPYRNGGSDPNGFDCSGFTQWVFAQVGFALPREVEEQFKVGKKIRQDDLKPGDLVFFHTVSRGASHVGILVDGDQFVHAPSSKGVVRVESLSSSYWSPRFVGARRVEGAAKARESAVRRHPSDSGSSAGAPAAASSDSRGSKAAD